MHDEDIDYSDIPEQLDWTGAVRGKFYRPNERHTIVIRHADGSVETTHLEPNPRIAIRPPKRLSDGRKTMADHHSPTEHADHDADAYVHGTMTVEEQTATYALFMNLAKWGSLVIAALLLFLVLWFQPGGSFVAGFIAFVVVAVGGGFFLKSGKSH